MSLSVSSSFRASSKHGSEGAGSSLVHAFNLIKDVQKTFKQREQEKKELEVCIDVVDENGEREKQRGREREREGEGGGGRKRKRMDGREREGLESGRGEERADTISHHRVTLNKMRWY